MTLALRPFHVDIRHWKTAYAFEKHVFAHNASLCEWVQGITIHHTYKPTPETWRGKATMTALLHYYRDVCYWNAGPHLFIVTGSQLKDNDGIWQLTPMNIPGVHAASFNATHIGIEVVGDYTHQSWPGPTEALCVEAVVMLNKWMRRRLAVNGHRDDPQTAKTCPGDAVDLDAFRSRVNAILDHIPLKRVRVLYTARTRVSPSQKAQHIRTIKAGTEVSVVRYVTGSSVSLVIGEHNVRSSQWAHINTGEYIWKPLLQDE